LLVIFELILGTTSIRTLLVIFLLLCVVTVLYLCVI
jgi:hypothetical protein